MLTLKTKKKTDTAVSISVSVFRSRIRILPIARAYYRVPHPAAAVSKVSHYNGQPVLEYYSTHLSDFALVNRPNNCDFVGQSRTKRPTFPRPRGFRVVL
jgi:hypothetical protein